jgi:hypothetical protein
MPKVVVDDALRSRLNGLNAEVQLCDEAGQTVGHYVPARLYREMLDAWTKALFTDEELRQADRETGGRLLAEIWKSIGQQ